MGRHTGKKKSRPYDQAPSKDAEKVPYEAYVYKSNDRFETYYKAQNIVPEAEFPAFIAKLLEPLPSTWRVNPLMPSAPEITARLEAMADKSWVLDDGTTIESPRRLPWYPQGLAWHVSSPKSEFRKHAAFKEFHQWLIAQTDAGCITRQEAVSMVPPLLLNVEPEHMVLDMCASPGSKTSQMLEALHSGEKDGRAATGMVVANDNDSSRAYMLVHQCHRIGSHSLVVTCHDAQNFPNVYSGSSTAAGVPEVDQSPGSLEPATAGAVASVLERNPPFFDRVLCDVPCTGDGTARKNADVFQGWAPNSGIGLHALQLLIGMRGLQLLKEGGLMVYSTCSFNPMENEAVVAELLRRCAGTIELVDVSDRLPGLVRSPGLLTWRVFDHDLIEYASFGDVCSAARSRLSSNRVRRNTSKMAESLFPPPPEEASSMHLERCLRLLPHTQDTGGFFVALLRKRARLPLAARLHRPRFPGDVQVPLIPGAAHPPSASAAAPEAPLLVPAAEAPTAAVVADAAPDSSDKNIDAGGEALPEPSAGVAGVKRPREGAEEDAEDDSAGGITAAPKDAEVESGPLADAEEDSVADAIGALAPTDGAVVETAAGSGPTATSSAPVFGRRDPKADQWIYRVLDGSVTSQVSALFGLSTLFPAHLLLTRSEQSKTLIMVSESIARYIVPRCAEGPRSLRFKLVNLGLKVFDWNSGSVPSSQMYRLQQEGIHLVYPYMQQRVVLVSGAELSAVLRCKGQQFSSDRLSARLARLVDRFVMGSYVIVLTPALDGHDGDAADPYPEATGLRSVFSMSDDNLALQPRQTVSVAAATAIPPALRPHYIPDSADPTLLRFSPSPRTRSTSDHRGRLVFCMWRGVGKHSIMVPQKDVAWLEALFRSIPAYAHLTPPPPPTVSVDEVAAAPPSESPQA